jgi:hypothetical protein
MTRMTNGSLQPSMDFFWVVPAIIFAVDNPPAGFTTELSMMGADGQSIVSLTNDGEVVADHEWSPDGTKIVFRRTPTATSMPVKIRVLPLDDCN